MGFFKKLFDKKAEHEQEEVVQATPAVEDPFPSEWDSFRTFINDKIASIRINLALAKEAPYPGYQVAVRLKIALLDFDSQSGFPTNTEFDSLNSLEDRLAEELATVGGVQVGVITTDGRVEFYYYLQDKESYQVAISKVMEEFPERHFDLATLDDPEWDQYFNYLYPNDYEYQTILNQRVWYELEKAGNDHSKEREIDHWVYFVSEEQETAFLAEIQELGYSLAEQSLEKASGLYQLHLVRMDKTELPDLNRKIWELVEIVKKYDGNYGGWGCNLV